MTRGHEDWDGIGGVILDAVGTLIEPTPPVAEVYAGAARAQGLDVDPAEVRSRFHRFFRVDCDDEPLGSLATSEAIEFRRWRRIVSDVLPDLPDPRRGFAELWDHFGSASAWRAFADVRPTLDALRGAGLRVVVASNFDARLRRVLLGLPDLSDLEPGVVISSEVGHRKPHPAFYEAACRRLGLEPSAVLCVGDDPENDVEGPERAGLRGLLIDRDGRSPLGLASRPDLTSMLPPLLGAVPSRSIDELLKTERLDGFSAIGR